MISLKEEEITLIRDEDSFDPEDFIEKILDECDEDPKLEISQLDWDADEQDISYRVSDSSGNHAEAILHVIITEKPKERPKPAGSSAAAVQPAVSGNSYPKPEESSGGSDQGNSGSVPQTEEAKVYCHNVTVSIGTDPGSAAYSTYDGLSGNITVSIQYPELNTSAPGTYPVYYINSASGETLATAYVTVTE